MDALVDDLFTLFLSDLLDVQGKRVRVDDGERVLVGRVECIDVVDIEDCGRAAVRYLERSERRIMFSELLLRDALWDMGASDDEPVTLTVCGLDDSIIEIEVDR